MATRGAKSLNDQQRIFYIDGLKGIACVMIMVCHYIGVVKYSADMTGYSITTKIYGSLFFNFINENYWLQIFFVTSGFLLGSAKIVNLVGLLKKILKRFLRFYLPILAACFLIYILGKTVGFHNAQTDSLFLCYFFQADYERNLSFLDLVVCPFKTVLVGNETFNAPYWVIRDMFYSSVLIYAITYLTTKSKHQKGWSILIYAVLICFTGFSTDKVISACLAGALCGAVLPLVKDYIEVIPEVLNNILCVICMLMPFGLQIVLYRMIYQTFQNVGFVPSRIGYFQYTNSLWGVIFLVFVIALLSNNKLIQGILSWKVFCGLNEICFGIYSFHWPVLCSIGALIILTIPSKTGMLLAWGVCMVLTIVISIFYHIVFENQIDKLLKDKTVLQNVRVRFQKILTT